MEGQGEQRKRGQKWWGGDGYLSNPLHLVQPVSLCVRKRVILVFRSEGGSVCLHTSSQTPAASVFVLEFSPGQQGIDAISKRGRLASKLPAHVTPRLKGETTSPSCASRFVLGGVGGDDDSWG